MSEFIEVLSKEAKAELDAFIKQLNEGVKSVNQINASFKKTKVPSSTNKQIKKTTQSTKKLSAMQKESIRLSKALQTQKAKSAKASGIQAQGLQRLRFETTKANAASKQRAIISSALSTAYQKEQAKINILSDRYRELATRQQLHNNLSRKEAAELRLVTAQINKKQIALKRVDANMGNYQRNVGNYTSAWGGLGSMLKTTIMAFGAFAAIDIARDIFNTVKEVNSLNKALQQVTDSQEAFNQATEFIIKVAERTGAGINQLQKAYVKFFAAAKTTNLSLKDTQELFENVSTAAAVLGLSTDDTEGSLKALEQMLSKGKVQAEEIRGQLGERLPGAFQILAKSIGLTTSQLSKQLELGNIYADEVLPKFARELAKTYSLDTVNRVETLAAAQGRLGNEWNLFIRDIEGGDGAISGILQGFFNIATLLIKSWREISVMFSDAFESLNPLFKAINDIFISIFGVKGTNQIKKFVALILKATMTIQWKALAGAIKLVGALLNGSISSANGFRLTLVQIAIEFARIITAIQNFDITKPFESAKNIDVIGLAASFLNVGKNVGNAFTEGFNQVWNFEAEAIKEDDTKKTVKKAKATGRALAEGIGKAFAIDSPKIDQIVSGTLDFISPNTSLAEYIRLTREAEANTLKLAKALENLTQKQIIMGELQSLGNIFNFDVSKIEGFFEDYEDKLTSASLATMEILGGIGQTIMQNDAMRIDNQIAANRRYYQDQIEQAQGNEQQQQILREQQERKEKELLTRRAKAEQDNAIFQIGVNTAVAIIKTFANKGFVAGLPFAALMAGIGAAQIAVVKSQPLPEYKKGRKGGKEEYAILGDGYKNELVFGEDGSLKGVSPNKPTVMHLDKGDSVLPNLDMLTNDSVNRAAIMASLQTQNYKAEDTAKVFEQILKNQQKETMRALKKAKFVNNNFNKVDISSQLRKMRYR